MIVDELASHVAEIGGHRPPIHKDVDSLELILRQAQDDGLGKIIGRTYGNWHQWRAKEYRLDVWRRR